MSANDAGKVKPSGPSAVGSFALGLAAGMVAMGGQRPSVAAPIRQAAPPLPPAVVKRARPDEKAWQAQLRGDLRRQAVEEVDCRAKGKLDIYLFGSGLDFAHNYGQSVCNRQIKTVSIDLGATKNGTNIPQLDGMDSNGNSAKAIAPDGVYLCNVCNGQWTAKTGAKFYKFPVGQVIAPPVAVPYGDCNIVTNDNGSPLGYYCFSPLSIVA
jgi:hypothetical protein